MISLIYNFQIPSLIIDIYPPYQDPSQLTLLFLFFSFYHVVHEIIDA